jgi:hypothetical protein
MNAIDHHHVQVWQPIICIFLLCALALSGCIPIPLLWINPADPAPGLLRSTKEARNYECNRLSQAQAHEQMPGLIRETQPRKFLPDIEVLSCHPRFIEEGERPARDEAILRYLSSEIRSLTRVAETNSDASTVWHVDAYYPNEQVASKIAVAARVELVERRHHVSDSVPLLAAGDIAVLARMPAATSYATACRRYFAEGSLSNNEALLAVMIIDARETQLHAGICQHAQWRWLQ